MKCTTCQWWKPPLSLPKSPLSYGQTLMWYLAVKLNASDVPGLDIPIIIDLIKFCLLSFVFIPRRKWCIVATGHITAFWSDLFRLCQSLWSSFVQFSLHLVRNRCWVIGNVALVYDVTSSCFLIQIMFTLFNQKPNCLAKYSDTHGR